mgnify:CR=1 FL=1
MHLVPHNTQNTFSLAKGCCNSARRRSMHTKLSGCESYHSESCSIHNITQCKIGALLGAQSVPRFLGPKLPALVLFDSLPYLSFGSSRSSVTGIPALAPPALCQPAATARCATARARGHGKGSMGERKHARQDQPHLG